MASRAVASGSAPATWRASLVVAVVALAHRGAVFAAHQEDLRTLVAANPAWWTMQNPPLPALQDHLLATLLMFQQTPPMSALVIGLFGNLVSWPFGGAVALIAFNTVVSAATAVLLHRLLLVCLPGRVVVATIIAVAFVLSADLLVLEYNSFGQTLYENLGMLLVLALALALLRVRTAPPVRAAAVAGAIAGMLVLTRATWSFIAVPGVLMVLAFARRDRRRAAVGFLVPLIVLQGGWAMKNWAVYGRFSPAPTSWTGLNLANGLTRIGYGDLFPRFVAERREPAWLAASLFGAGDPAANPMPPVYAERDRRVTERFGVEQWSDNSAKTAAIWDAIQANVVAFMRVHPEVVLEKSWLAYHIFWQPIASYGGFRYAALFAPTGPSPSGLEVRQTLGDLARGALPRQLGVAGGRAYATAAPVRPVSTWTTIAVDPLRLVLTVVGVHLLAPLAGLGWAWTRLRQGALTEPDATRAAALVVCGVLYAYLAGISSFGEFGENMRFRLGVEPLVWTLTVLGIVGCWRVARSARA